MKNIVKTVLVLSCFLATKCLYAQTYNLDTIKANLYKVNRIFDSSRYQGIDINFIYDTDTLFGKFEHDEVPATYIINNRNVYYKIGDAEYVQTDSFVYNIANDEKMLVMTKDPVTSNSSLFPLKDFVDSVINIYQAYYTITMEVKGDDKVIRFQGTAANLPYSMFSIQYDSISYYPRRFEMTMLDEFDLSQIPDSLLSQVKLKQMHKRVTMSFDRYYSVDDVKIFQDANYVLYDPSRKLYRPTARFRGYRFLTNGVEGENTDPDTEQNPEVSNPY